MSIAYIRIDDGTTAKVYSVQEDTLVSSECMVSIVHDACVEYISKNMGQHMNLDGLYRWIVSETSFSMQDIDGINEDVSLMISLRLYAGTENIHIDVTMDGTLVSHEVVSDATVYRRDYLECMKHVEEVKKDLEEVYSRTVKHQPFNSAVHEVQDDIDTAIEGLQAVLDGTMDTDMGDELTFMDEQHIDESLIDRDVMPELVISSDGRLLT